VRWETPGHGVPGYPGEESGHEVERSQGEKDRGQGAEVDTDAADRVGRARPGQRAGWCLLLRIATACGCVRSGRQSILAELLADEAVHELVDGVARILGPNTWPAVLSNATPTTRRMRGRSGLSSPIRRRRARRKFFGFSTGIAIPPIGPMPPRIGPRPRPPGPPIGPPGAPPCFVPPAGPLMPLPPGSAASTRFLFMSRRVLHQFRVRSDPARCLRPETTIWSRGGSSRLAGPR